MSPRHCRTQHRTPAPDHALHPWSTCPERPSSPWRLVCAGQDVDIARLILINGPPGVGKSTIARRYLDDHPLTLLIEIDGLRVSLGGWAQHEESKLVARTLALALVREHLAAGHDVVVPQYLGRTDFIEALEGAASAGGAAFRHIVVMDEVISMVERFERRRRELTAGGQAHPEADVTESEVSAVIADAVARLEQVAVARADVRVVPVPTNAEDLYRVVLAAIEATTSS